MMTGMTSKYVVKSDLTVHLHHLQETSAIIHIPVTCLLLIGTKVTYIIQSALYFSIHILLLC